MISKASISVFRDRSHETEQVPHDVNAFTARDQSHAQGHTRLISTCGSGFEAIDRVAADEALRLKQGQRV